MDAPSTITLPYSPRRDDDGLFYLSFSPNNTILLNHNPFLIDGKSSFTVLKNYPTIPATRSLPGGFGSLQGFFEVMAVVGGHIGGEDKPGMS